jgi:hypothetical protein
VEKKLPTPFFPIGGPPVPPGGRFILLSEKGTARPPGEVGMYVDVPSDVFEVFQKVLEGKLDMWTDGDVIYIGEEKRPYFPVLMIGKGRIFIIEDLIEELQKQK